MQKRQGLNVSDFIQIAIYAVIYFFLVAIAALICVFLVPVLIPGMTYPYVLIPVFAALLAGTPYMLVGAKVQKFGVFTLFISIMALFFLFAFPYATVFAFIIGLLADWIASRSGYKSKRDLLISYVVFSFGMSGPILPMYFFPEWYERTLVESFNRTPEQIAQTMSVASPGYFIVIVILIILAALIGGWFGQKMVSKHFEKAGIV